MSYKGKWKNRRLSFHIIRKTNRRTSKDQIPVGCANPCATKRERAVANKHQPSANESNCKPNLTSCHSILKNSTSDKLAFLLSLFCSSPLHSNCEGDDQDHKSNQPTLVSKGYSIYYSRIIVHIEYYDTTCKI